MDKDAVPMTAFSIFDMEINRIRLKGEIKEGKIKRTSLKNRIYDETVLCIDGVFKYVSIEQRPATVA